MLYGGRMGSWLLTLIFCFQNPQPSPLSQGLGKPQGQPALRSHELTVQGNGYKGEAVLDLYRTSELEGRWTGLVKAGVTH